MKDDFWTLCTNCSKGTSNGRSVQMARLQMNSEMLFFPSIYSLGGNVQYTNCWTRWSFYVSRNWSPSTFCCPTRKHQHLSSHTEQRNN